MADRSRLRAFGQSGGFRMVKLNPAGWGAVLAPGAVLGVLVGLRTRRPAWIGAVVGAAASWAVALVIDSNRWRPSEITMVLPDLPQGARAELLSVLARENVDATFAQVADPDTGELRWELITTMRS